MRQTQRSHASTIHSFRALEATLADVSEDLDAARRSHADVVKLAADTARDLAESLSTAATSASIISVISFERP